jgi:hypothetical protein
MRNEDLESHGVETGTDNVYCEFESAGSGFCFSVQQQEKNERL